MGLLEELKEKNKGVNIGIGQKNEMMSGKSNPLSMTNGKSNLAILNRGIANPQTTLQNRVNNYSSAIIEQTTKQLHENTTELIFLIDKSSSCTGLESDTCIGYNQLIEKEKRSSFPTKVTTVLFNHNIEEIGFRQEISTVQKLQYEAGGETSLYDAFCSTIEKIEKARTMATIKPNRTVVAIMTDGMDISSKYYDIEDMKNIIRRCQNQGWEFLFLGALENAQEIAASVGIKLENSVESKNTGEGMLANFQSISLALDDLKQYGKITPDWKKPIKTITEEKGKQKRIGVKNG